MEPTESIPLDRLKPIRDAIGIHERAHRDRCLASEALIGQRIEFANRPNKKTFVVASVEMDSVGCILRGTEEREEGYDWQIVGFAAD